MTDRPIIFSAPMVRALLDGRKTQTRRALKPQPSDPPPAKCHPAHTARHLAPYLDAYCGEPKTTENPRGMSRIWHWWQVDDRCGPVAFKAAYAPGDRLWVRETWAMVPYTAYLHSDGVQMTAHAGTYEAAIYKAGFDRSAGGIRWRSPIHMPRWASRITLTVTDVRVQRLQEISEADALAEGVYAWHHPEIGQLWAWHQVGVVNPPDRTRITKKPAAWDNPRHAFFALWTTIHGPDAWDANQWVAALTFTVERRNIDEGGGDG